MIKKILITILFSLSLGQVSVQVTQSSDFSNGEQPNLPFPLVSTSINDYIINEHLFDVSTSYKNFYVYTQFEYSDPPVFGETRNTLDNLLNTYYLSFLLDKAEIKVGEIHSVYGRGLMFNTFQDQSTDFDNSISGIELGYTLADWLSLYSVYGKDEYEFRTRPDLQLNDLSLDNTTLFLGSTIDPISDVTLNIQYLNQRIGISDSVMTEGGVSSLEYYSNLFTVFGNDVEDSIGAFISDDIDKYQINADMIGLSLSAYLGTPLYIDFYGEYVSNKHTRLTPGLKVGEETTGSLIYGALSADVLGAGLTYEFKRYDMPYFIPITSFGPIVYKEPSSVLQSRISHNMNFVNEIGHQFDVIYPVNDNINMLFNVSAAHRIHPFNGQVNSIVNTFSDSLFNESLATNGIEYGLANFNTNNWAVNTTINEYNYSTPNIMSVLFMDEDEEVFSFWPYRQLYVGVNGYLFDEKLYFSMGYDLFDHVKQWGGEYELGMTHSNYSFLGYESVNSTISEYWYAESEDWDPDDYWSQFNLYYDWYNPDSTLAHEYAESNAGFSIDDYNNIDNLIIESQEIAGDSLDFYISSNRNNYQWHYESESAITIPTQFAWNFGDGSSILVYLEQQWREKKLNQDINYLYISETEFGPSGDINSDGSNLEEANEKYISVSYKNNKLGTFTLFVDHEKNTKTALGDKIEKTKQWNGIQWTYNFKSKEGTPRISKYIFGNSKLSIFYGSQRGGLICANGICAIQPEFQNGVKLSYNRMF